MVSVRAANPRGSDGPSVTDILARNTFTWLNLILVGLGAATLATGSAPDATFLFVALINTVVGTFQEVRAKAALNRLAVLHAPLESGYDAAALWWICRPSRWSSVM